MKEEELKQLQEDDKRAEGDLIARVRVRTVNVLMYSCVVSMGLS